MLFLSDSGLLADVYWCGSSITRAEGLEECAEKALDRGRVNEIEVPRLPFPL